jgi:hypothetical protein
MILLIQLLIAIKNSKINHKSFQVQIIKVIKCQSTMKIINRNIFLIQAKAIKIHFILQFKIKIK